MKSWLWNGQAYAEADSVPLTDRGFRYGMSFFESLRVEGGEAEFFERHLTRLMSACAEHDFAVEEPALRAAQEQLSNAGFDGFGRIYVTAGDGGPATPATAPRVYVFLEPRKPVDEEDSFAVTLSDETYRPLFAGMKTANYWFNCAALDQARRNQFDEALLFNDFAELVSACCANVFVVHDDRISTPSRSSGTRLGVIREWVTARRRVEERRLRREDVIEADEVFLTNSWLGVMPVATVEGRPLGYRRVGPKLAAELRNRRTSP
jgi:branched-subunit amino acid aminotransferase/4-amino-4-deoxychorismate lyase